MARKILSIATLGLVKPKKKAAAPAAAPEQQKGPVITQLGGRPAGDPQRAAQRRRYMGQVGTVLSDKLGG